MFAPSREYWLRKQHQDVNAVNLVRKYKPASEHHGSNAELNDLILELYYDDILDYDDVVLLLDGQRHRRNLHLEQPYWRYPAFDLERMEDHECKVEFRFTKREIYQLVETFELPEQIRCYNGTVLNSVEALCVCLKRFAYPCRYVDLIPRFTRPVPHLSMIANMVADRFSTGFNTC